MNDEIKTYYIPTNPNIKNGQIYTLYINNNNNLDLTSIVSEEKKLTNKMVIDIQKYNNLLKVNKQIQDTINKSNISIENFLKEHKQNTNELVKLNIEYNNMLKTFPVRSDKSA